MHNFRLAYLPLLTTLALVGCSSTNTPDVVTTAPARMALGVFVGADMTTAKTAIMSACSNSRLHIQTTTTEVLCTASEIDARREAMIDAMVNNEWALRYKDVISFALTAEGKNTRVIANPYVQFIQPMGIMSELQVKTRNLLDDASFQKAQQLLKAAGATE